MTDKTTFEFPDEKDKDKTKAVEAPELEIEVVDDTPPADRNKVPLPEDVRKELEDDDLQEYSEKVRKRLSQMKKAWHDERREKEARDREAAEALRLAQAREQEIKQLRAQLGAGQKAFSEEITKSAEFEVTSAKKLLQQAYEEGDPVKIADAQEALTDAKIKLKEAQYRRPPLQSEEVDVQTQTQAQDTRVAFDPKAAAWKAKNTWFGVDEEMTSLALGLHQKLVRQGVDPKSDDYYSRVDEGMRKRFPEQFEAETPDDTDETPSKPTGKDKPRKPATVVAPASRSTAPKKVQLTATALALAKKLGIPPEQYAKEVLKLETNNG